VSQLGSDGRSVSRVSALAGNSGSQAPRAREVSVSADIAHAPALDEGRSRRRVRQQLLLRYAKPDMCSVGLAQPDLPGGDALGARSRQTRASNGAIQRTGADDNLHGRGGIRTPEAGLTRLAVFKTAAFNRSATLPRESRRLVDSSLDSARRLSTDRRARPTPMVARRCAYRATPALAAQARRLRLQPGCPCGSRSVGRCAASRLDGLHGSHRPSRRPFRSSVSSGESEATWLANICAP
jgi:hypothetical protein